MHENPTRRDAKKHPHFTTEADCMYISNGYILMKHVAFSSECLKIAVKFSFGFHSVSINRLIAVVYWKVSKTKL